MYIYAPALEAATPTSVVAWLRACAKPTHQVGPKLPIIKLSVPCDAICNLHADAIGAVCVFCTIHTLNTSPTRTVTVNS